MRPSSSKIRRKNLKQAETLDRISDLPDCILSYILSLLQTRDAFRTCVLSRRWRYVFASTPNLDFDDSPISGTDSNVDGKGKLVQRRDFAKFVRKMLSLREGENIKKVRFKLENDYDSRDVESWLSSALFPQIQELDIGLLFPCFELPSSDSVFNCKTLVVLDLSVNLLWIPDTVCLPSLRILRLRNVLLEVDKSSAGLISACHVLEELVIRDCFLLTEGVLTIQNSTLKTFILESLNCADDSESLDFQVVIDAPCLEYFMYEDPMGGGYVSKNMDSLVKADIKILRLGNRLKNSITDLLAGISGVKSLFLRSHDMMALSQCYPPMFPNLTHLELAIFNPFELAALHKLLGCCPKLEVFILEVQSRIYGDGDGFSQHLPSCLGQQLREIELHSFSLEEDELSLVDYLLQHAKALKKFTVRVDVHCKVDGFILEKLLWHPRTSSTRSIQVTCSQEWKEIIIKVQ